MPTQKQKIIVVLGPTAVGKSDFAVLLAKKYNGEIISADSRQVYKGGDLLSGKITEKEMKGVPHYCLNLVPFSSAFSVTEWRKHTIKALKKISKNERVPIICGGTGMYIDSLLENKEFPAVPPNKELREKLSPLSAAELFQRLETLDKRRASTIDKSNTHRMIRAIEIAEALGEVPEVITKESPYEVLYIGLTLPKEELDARITKRVQKRMSRGMLEELKDLHKKYGIDKIRPLGLEFKVLSDFVETKLSQEEALMRLTYDIIHYAKRQMTWFKRNKKIHWIHPTEYDKKELRNLIKNFLSS
jgi:tRNA dimethylallyltransferase